MISKMVAIETLPVLDEECIKYVVEAAGETYLRQLDTHYPIVLKNGVISSGHGRLWAAIQAGRKFVPVQELD